MSTSTRGFAGMSLEKRREISSKGGKAAHDRGTAHTYSKAEAEKYGRIGGFASGKSRRSAKELQA